MKEFWWHRHWSAFVESRFHQEARDRGSVESALVLIPTLMLFMGVLQISGFFLFQTGISNFTQGKVAKAALFGSNENLDNFDVDTIALPGGGSILLGSKAESLPAISTLFLRQMKTNSTGIAIREN